LELSFRFAVDFRVKIPAGSLKESRFCLLAAGGWWLVRI
jgi:hypothetical protein